MRSLDDRTYLPNRESDQSVIDEKFHEILSQFELGNHNSTERPNLLFGDKRVELPEEMIPILIQVAEALSQGLAVTVAPHAMIVSTQEAADILGVSRPTLVSFLEEGKIPFQKLNRHRRLYLVDVLEYRDRQRRRSDEMLADMVSDSQMYGDYDVDQALVEEALRNARNAR